MMKEFNSKEFKYELVNSKELLVVEFYTTWCQYCTKLDSELYKITNAGFDVIKIDIDKEKELSDSYKIEVYPTDLFFKNGREVRRMYGVLYVENIIEEIKLYSK